MTRRQLLTALGAGAVAPALASPRNTIPSVLGPLGPDQLGFTLPHEHITAGEWTATERQRNSIRCVWNMLAPQLRANGLRTLVDLTPPDSSRDIPLMQDVARASGLNIVCATGYYVPARRPANFLTGGVAGAESFMLRELTEPIGETGVRAALMKIAVGGRPDNPSDEILLEATARVQKQTGAPVSTHSTTPEHRRHLLEKLEKHGADMSRVAVGHADTNATLPESIEVLSRCGFLVYTIWGITNPQLIGSREPVPADHSARLVRGLLEKGLGSKVMFSIDFAPILLRGDGIDVSNYEIPERTSNYVFTFVLPQLKKLGVSDDEIRQMTVINPRRHLFGA